MEELDRIQNPEEELLKGCAVVIDDRRVRVHYLPTS